MSTRLLILLAPLCCCPSLALSTFSGSRAASRFSVQTPIKLAHLILRGGEQQGEDKTIDEPAVESLATKFEIDQEAIENKLGSSTQSTKSPLIAGVAGPMVSSLASFGAAYGASLQKRPIATKSITAGFIFALSDYLAQHWETTDGEKKAINKTRMVVSALVGLLYFGPAAHAWYKIIFKILPGTSLVSTLQKAALGQVIFGPSFTCVFFATALLQSRTFSIGNWLTKIKNDLPGAWIAGLGFWPLVDLVSYSMIRPQWIPLFVNSCSLFWTIYLSLIANKKSVPKQA